MVEEPGGRRGSPIHVLTGLSSPSYWRLPRRDPFAAGASTADCRMLGELGYQTFAPIRSPALLNRAASLPRGHRTFLQSSNICARTATPISLLFLRSHVHLGTRQRANVLFPLHGAIISPVLLRFVPTSRRAEWFWKIASP